MNSLHIADNLIRLRHEKKLTQEEVADFVGVTKASVSKWENGQSMPDIMLLPQLASFFGVTVDELLGYEAWLSPEQISRCYTELTENFARLPFGKALEQAKALVHRYYSCYPFLLQICVLYINHFMLAETEEEKKQLLQDGERLCDRILEGCRERKLCSDAVAMKAVIKLLLGEAAEAVGLLEEEADPLHLSAGNGMALIQAYQMAGEMEKARSYTQVNHYIYMLNLVETGRAMLSLYGSDLKRCEEIMRRMDGLVELYDIRRLHPNAAGQYFYQAALVLAGNREDQKALEKLREFERCVCQLMEKTPVLLHGDGYFDRMDEWIERLPLGGQPPRDQGFIRANVLEALSHPGFDGLRDREEFRRIRRRIQSAAAGA